MLITALLLIASVAIHEAAHAGAAWHLGYRVTGVRWRWYGPGVRVVSDHPPTPADLRVIALMGPVANLILAGVFNLVGMHEIALLNLFFAAVNLVPIKPTDGYVILTGGRGMIQKIER